jgi:thiamine-monophosphate kinase
VIGESRGELLRRDAARPGDTLAVTGSLGASSGGLRLLESGRRPGEGPAALFEAHCRPRPRVAEAAALVEAGVRCGMDVSDGLLGDAAHIGERSGLGVVIDVDAVPVHPDLAAAFGTEALARAVGGGEDYELLCAARPEVIERARTALGRSGTPLTAVGRLVERRPTEPLVRLVDRAGRPVELAGASWDHFRG